ncbi:MAG: PaaI family thioesterase [Streptosporangiaceae bacterium]
MAATEWSPSDERRELGEALRRLLDVVVRTGASPADLKAAVATVEELTASLADPTVQADMSVRRDSYRAHMSLVGGLSHPIAPQLAMALAGDSGTGEVVVGPLFQGGPGLVHGGVIALLIDHAMGCVAARPERPAMTVRLAIRYRRPTPLGVPLTVSATLDRIEGRKLHLSGTIIAAGEVTVEADAIFLTLTSENMENVFSWGDTAGRPSADPSAAAD